MGVSALITDSEIKLALGNQRATEANFSRQLLQGVFLNSVHNLFF